MILSAALVVVLLAGVAVAVGARGDGDGAPPGTQVEGVDVGGLSPDDTWTAVRDRAREMLDDEIVFTSPQEPDFRRAVVRRALQPSPAVADTADAAHEPRGFVRRLRGRLGLGGDRDIAIPFTYDEQRVAAAARAVEKDIAREPRPASVVVNEGRLRTISARDGIRVDGEAILQEIAAFDGDVALAAEVDPPPILDEAAMRASTRAERLLATPPRVILGTLKKQLAREDIVAALAFTPVAPDIRVDLREDVLSAALGPAFAEGERTPRDAEFKVSGENVVLVPDLPGRGVDMARLARTLVRRAGKPQTGARFEQIPATFTTEDAEKLKITERVSTFFTPYTCCPDRVTNIRQAAQVLDGVIIPANGVFSLNKELGQRTTERGFVPAGQITAGKLEDAVGGGVSQVATTLYNAAFFAGLEIIDHTPHQFYISRYPAGREATVSWGGPELIFKNDWPASILVKMSADTPGITVSFYSSKLGRRVETESGPRTGITAPKEISTLNKDLEPGGRVVEQSAGASGFTIAYTRKVFRGDELIKDEDYGWRYSPQNAFVEVGPKKKKKKKEEEEEEKPGEEKPGEEKPGDTDPDAPSDEQGGAGTPPAEGSDPPAETPPDTPAPAEPPAT